MDCSHKNYSFAAGENLLRVPFAVNVRDSTPKEIDELLLSITDKLGAKYFRDKGLLMEVLHDQFVEAAKPKKFLSGPFVGVFIKENGEVRATTYDMPQGGMAVYSHEQYHSLADTIDEPLDAKNAVKRAMPRP